MPEYVETASDYSIKYSGCYALAEGLDDKYAPVIQIGDLFHQNDEGIVTKAKASQFYRTPKNQTRSSDNYIPISSLILKPLRLGAINLSKSVIFLKSLKPEGSTKYRKLPCNGNFSMVDPFLKERQFLDIRSPSSINDYFILNAWGNREFFPATEALAQVMDHQRLGAAFNHEYFFGISYAGDGIFLYKNGCRTARVNTNGEVVLKPVVHPLSEQLAEFGLNVKKVTK